MNEQLINSNSLTQQDLERLQRTHTEVMDHLVASKRTYQEEYELVQQKQSSLSKRGRDYVTLLAIYEATKASEEEITPTNDTDNTELKEQLSTSDKV